MAGRTAKRALTCLVVAGALVSFGVPGPGASATRPPTTPIGRCGWPTWGQGNERRFAYPCPSPEGRVRRIRFVHGEPQPPEIMGAGLQYPDGIGVYAPKKM